MIERRRFGRPPAAARPVQKGPVGVRTEIARPARDPRGGNGTAGGYHVIRHVMDRAAVDAGEDAHIVHALVHGRARTGKPTTA